jgi:hypothetical protein
MAAHFFEENAASARTQYARAEIFARLQTKCIFSEAHVAGEIDLILFRVADANYASF